MVVCVFAIIQGYMFLFVDSIIIILVHVFIL